MEFFKKPVKPETDQTGIVFIVEDNKAYAQTIEAFLRSGFPAIREVRLFPVGETCVMALHKNPDVIIIDHHLDTKYFDAETGLQTIARIRAEKPDVRIIVLSAQREVDVVIESVEKYNCNYVKKDDEAFDRLEKIFSEIY